MYLIFPTPKNKRVFLQFNDVKWEQYFSFQAFLRSSFTYRRLKFSEGILEKNEVVSVLGYGHWEALDSTTLIMESGEKQLYISDVFDSAE